MTIRCFETDFESEQPSILRDRTRRIVTTGPDRTCRHAFAPSVHRHSNGHFLITCRWDETGSREGDASNEQALFFSTDQGQSWTMAHDGRPIITWESGTGFPIRSSITHSFLFEDGHGRTWIFYTTNQPFTWNGSEPDRSTGGGTVRKVEVHFDGRTWTTSGQSLPVWGMRQPVADEWGGLWGDIRLVTLNPILRIDDKTLLLPVAGRSTITEPQGVNWRLDRSWVLLSPDDGQSWTESRFIGGNHSLPLCEPVLVPTSHPGHILCFLRPGYGVSNQVYRSLSPDSGRTWSPPHPAGLPNPALFGCKPFVARAPDGRYHAVVTNETELSDRTNLALFTTTEAGLLRNHWPSLKTISTESRGQWAGAGYGCLDFEDDGSILAVWASFDATAGYINFARLPADIAGSSIIEPNGIGDQLGNHLPVRSLHGNRWGYRFDNVRGRLIANQFARLVDGPQTIESEWLVQRLPGTEDFHFNLFRSRVGGELAFSVSLRPGRNRNFWARCNQGTVVSLQDFRQQPEDWVDLGLTCPIGKPFSIRCTIDGERHVHVTVDDRPPPAGCPLYLKTSSLPDSLLLGTACARPDPCLIICLRVRYESGGDHGQAKPELCSWKLRGEARC